MKDGGSMLDNNIPRTVCRRDTSCASRGARRLVSFSPTSIRTRERTLMLPAFLTLPARHSLVLVAAMAALAGAAGAQATPVGTPAPTLRSIDAAAIPALPPVRPEPVRALLSALAADSMEGRATGAPGSARAAR